MAREPGYCLHKPSGRAYVRFDGTSHYLGPYGSEESKEAYARLKAEWLVNRNAAEFTPNASGATMAQVALAYLDHAEVYYKAGSEYRNLNLALNPISELYATLPASEFGVI